MFGKCRYLDEITGGRGVIFATGTPLSNSMTEMYTLMRYLQYNTLQQKGLTHFDAWASTFGETTTAIELAPEGTGYRARTRFAKFFNAPTLIVATVTSRTEKKRYQPTHVLIAHNTAFEKPSVVQLEQIFTIDKSRIQRFLGQTTRHEMRRIEEALMNSLEINEWDRRNADE